jgi:hypothetical protein
MFPYRPTWKPQSSSRWLRWGPGITSTMRECLAEPTFCLSNVWRPRDIRGMHTWRDRWGPRKTVDRQVTVRPPAGATCGFHRENRYRPTLVCALGVEQSRRFMPEDRAGTTYTQRRYPSGSPVYGRLRFHDGNLGLPLAA